MTEVSKGSCLCGKVNFNINGQLRGVMACHCTQCRKQSGHFYAATNAQNDAINLSGAENITWFEASDLAKRGFCKHCGSALFWKPNEGDYTSILAGSFEEPNNLKLDKHIFCSDKGSYYEIEDGLPKFDQGDG